MQLRQIYKADINELPLSVFIEVYTNDNHGVKFDIPTDEAVAKVVGDYMAIVGGKQIASEVVNANRRLNLVLMVECMTACENLILLNNWKGVCDTLLILGKNETGLIVTRPETLNDLASKIFDSVENED